MATLIPALASCRARMTSGEQRLAERLEQKLEDDYLLKRAAINRQISLQ